MHGTQVKELPSINHKLLDEICPATFEEMREKDGLGSDNMTIICVDLLKHNGGANGKANGVATRAAVKSTGLGEPKAAGVPSTRA